jgi:hypothetical protein
VITLEAAASDEAVTGDVIIVANTGAVTSLVNGWEYVEKGAIADVVPAVGQFGTEISITGNRLLGGAGFAVRVTLAGVEASIDSSSASEVNVTAQSSSEDITGDVVVVSSNGIATTGSDLFTYSEDGAIDEVSPNQGIEGATVLITGQDLRGQGDGIVSVTLSGTTAAIVKETNFYVKITAGAGTPGDAGDVVITANTGAIISASETWTYSAAANVTDVDPPQGTYGTSVIISGTDLFSGSTNLATVSLAGVDARIVSQNDTVVLVVAAHTDDNEGVTGAIVLTNEDGAIVTSETNWTYLPQSEIHSVTPSTGQYGTKVVIKGAQLLAGSGSLSSASLAGVDVAEIVEESESEIVVIAAAHSEPLVGDIKLVAENGASSERVDGWEYVAPGEIVSVAPSVGQAGTVVVIEGTDLLGGAAELATVFLGGTEVEQVVVSSNVQVVVVSASNTSLSNDTIKLVASTGAVIENTDGLWSYLQAGEIDSVSPSEGQEGTVITISGERLLGGGDEVVAVTLVGNAAEILSQNNTDVIISAAAGDPGAGHIVLTSNTGAVISLEGGFTYVESGSIRLMSPSRGQLGTFVSIHGTDLLGAGENATSVKLGGVEVSEIISATGTLIKVRADSSEDIDPGIGDVEIVSDSGSVVSSDNLWTYDVHSNITDVCV